MREGRWRWVAVVCCICTIFCLSAYMIHNERASCMGVPILTEKEQSQFTEYEYFDFSPYLLFRGEAAAIDVASSTIYLSQPVEANTMSWDLQGELEITLPQYTLYFEESPNFNSLAETMSAGSTLKLLVSDGSSKYMEYNVVLTSLPVIQMKGEVTSVNDDGRDVWSGDFCIWSANDPESDSYTVKTSNVQWHIRGRSSATKPKKSWKLALKNKHSENQNLSLLGLGTDDDWILNSMSFDDTKIREKLTIDWWNEIAGLSSSDMMMSSGEFVEVIVDGEYVGLYLLQRRVDAKYLGLSENDILLKGKISPVTSEFYFDIIYTPLSEDETYKMAETIKDGTSYSYIEVDRFVDLNLLLQFSAAFDNAGITNMFFVFIYESGGYRLYYIPWDTDMSYGIIWTDSGFTYDYALTMGKNAYHNEYYAYIEQKPEIIEQMRSRWTYLRSTVLSDENINLCVNSLSNQIRTSGAYSRDLSKWGVLYDGNDTVENLKKYILERSSLMDNTLAP